MNVVSHMRNPGAWLVSFQNSTKFILSNGFFHFELTDIYVRHPIPPPIFLKLFKWSRNCSSRPLVSIPLCVDCILLRYFTLRTLSQHWVIHTRTLIIYDSTQLYVCRFLFYRISHISIQLLQTWAMLDILKLDHHNFSLSHSSPFSLQVDINVSCRIPTIRDCVCSFYAFSTSAATYYSFCRMRIDRDRTTYFQYV